MSEEQYYQGFEQDGEEVVRNNVAMRRYSQDRQALAKEWLRRKDQTRSEEAERRRVTSSEEQIRIARSAKNAAWAAAIAAIIAAICAAVAIVISVQK
jgi:hypothetical protein